MIRWGLCCSFHDEPIRFGNTTAMSVRRMAPDLVIAKLEAVSACGTQMLCLLHCNIATSCHWLLSREQPDSAT